MLLLGSTALCLAATPINQEAIAWRGRQVNESASDQLIARLRRPDW